MADVRRPRGTRCDAADRDRAPAARELLEEWASVADLGRGRSAVRGLGAGMRRHHVPEEDVVLETELPEHPVDDRRRRLSWAAAGQLALRGERDSGDARPAVARSLADEEDRRVRVPLELV